MQQLYKITLIIGLFMLLLPQGTYATHYRAGEILYEQIVARRYKIIAISYTDPTSLADPATAELEVSFGDGTSEVLRRTSRTILNSRVVQNVYITTHEYRIGGNYIISYVDQNRVNGIVNVNFGRTEFIPFYVQTLLSINESLGSNRSPILTKFPIDNGCINKDYYHNPAAYDPDGDSLTFELTAPRQSASEEVPNYSIPIANDTFVLGLNNGQLFWRAPLVEGIYNIAIIIREFRRGKLIGYVTRDMQIFIDRCVNTPPVINNIDDGCVIVGDTIKRLIAAADAEAFQTVSLLGYGGPFVVNNKAYINPNPASGVGSVSTMFYWAPSCNQIRYMPWQTIFEARDNQIGSPAVSQNSFFVKVIGPKIINYKSKQVDNGFLLSWNRDTCQLAGEYRIYRRIDSSFWNPATCQTGIPESTGFKLIGRVATLNNPNVSNFYDNNGGKGLSPLVNYCYRIIAVYPPRTDNGEIIFSYPSENIASDEICDNMIVVSPAITKVSVLQTSNTNGKINVRYIRPYQLDTQVYQAPYLVIIKRFTGTGNKIDLLNQTFNAYSDITDYSFIDSLINTRNQQYIYQVYFSARVNGTQRVIDSSMTATSLQAIIYSTDRTNILSWNANVPWVNDSFEIFRLNTQNVFEKIAATTASSYTDTGLTNNQNYCYVIRSWGYYQENKIKKITDNFSQEICGTPIDTVRPCAPPLAVLSPCNTINDFTNKLTWTPKPACAPDVVKYRVYYKQLETDDYSLLTELSNLQFSFIDEREQLKQSITGCYYVAGVDSAGNESFPTNEICIDNCPKYEIPNFFSPNNDGKNDTLYPFPYRFVSNIDLAIYNRWGMEVYRTTDIDIKWNGNDQSTGMACPDGVYFYTCEVNEIYLSGPRKRMIRGTIQISR